MCKKKQSLKQGIDGKPTIIRLPNNIIKDIKNKRGGGKGINLKIPLNVEKDAKLGLKLLKLGFKGGTDTGWNRAKQLAFEKTIDIASLAEMRTWFARHGPDAKNGGTSYPGYCKWINENKPMNRDFNKYSGAVSWLILGGNSAYLWLKTKKIQDLLKKYFPKKKNSTIINNLYSNC